MSVEDWATFNGDLAATKHSKGTHITPANVHRLEKAWELQTGVMSDGKGAAIRFDHAAQS